MHKKFIYISTRAQKMFCYEGAELSCTYSISSGKNGIGEMMGSEKTPRGWHKVFRVIGEGEPVNTVFVGRINTGEVYSPALATQFSERDWILTRILQLDGQEVGRNNGGQVDSLARYIYIHGTPDETVLGVPGSHGCIRMRNTDIIVLAHWVNESTDVYID